MDDDMPSVSDNSEINDMRLPKEFRGVTFSEYKKLLVRNELVRAMLSNKIEPACYWCAELICAGHFMDVWEAILFFVGKYIHIGNPKIVVYLEKRYDVFRSILNQGEMLNELQLRNHPIIRKLFAEIISVLVISSKKNSFEAIKINRQEEYDITQMTERLLAPSVKYASDSFMKEDPNELYIALNEFAYNISSDRLNMRNACYWVEWILDFDLICRKNKQQCCCEPREFVKVESKYRTDCIWILWDILFSYCEKKNSTYISQLLQSLFQLFCIKYTTASCKRRRFLLYFAISLLTDHVPNNVELVTNKTIVSNVTNNINRVYKQLRANEHVPSTDYLFANLEKETQFENTMRKLQLVQSMDTS